VGYQSTFTGSTTEGSAEATSPLPLLKKEGDSGAINLNTNPCECRKTLFLMRDERVAGLKPKNWASSTRSQIFQTIHHKEASIECYKENQLTEGGYLGIVTFGALEGQVKNDAFSEIQQPTTFQSNNFKEYKLLIRGKIRNSISPFSPDHLVDL
jgi:hypothetical protein